MFCITTISSSQVALVIPAVVTVIVALLIARGYLLFGLPGVALLLLSIWLFLKSEEKKF
jgi:uncharacterized membrane protein YGL010W